MGAIIAYVPHVEPRAAKAARTPGQLAARAEAVRAMAAECLFLAATPATHRRHRSRVKLAAVQVGKYVQPLGLDWFEARDAILTAAGDDAGDGTRAAIEIGLNAGMYPADLISIAAEVDGLSPSAG